MSIKKELSEKFRDYTTRYSNTPNRRPARIILNKEAYNELHKTTIMKNHQNPVITYEDVVIACDSDQKERIKFEKRSFHSNNL